MASGALSVMPQAAKKGTGSPPRACGAHRLHPVKGRLIEGGGGGEHELEAAEEGSRVACVSVCMRA